MVSHNLYPENRGRGRARKSSTCPGPLPTPHATQALSKALPQWPPLAPVSPAAVLPAPISISVPVIAGLRGIPGGSLTQSPKLVTIYIEKHQIMLKIGLDTNFPLFKKNQYLWPLSSSLSSTSWSFSLLQSDPSMEFKNMCVEEKYVLISGCHTSSLHLKSKSHLLRFLISYFFSISYKNLPMDYKY